MQISDFPFEMIDGVENVTFLRIQNTTFFARGRFVSWKIVLTKIFIHTEIDRF